MFRHLAALWWALILLDFTSGAKLVKKSAIPDHGFEKISPAPADAPITLHIALSQPDNGVTVEEHLLRISDPEHPEFRKYPSEQEVLELSKPSGGCVRTVEGWLGENGLLAKTVMRGGGVLEVETSVREAEGLLRAKYAVWRDGDGGRKILRTEEFELPEEVEACVDFVTPTTGFPALKTKRNEGLERRMAVHSEQETTLRDKRRATCGSNDNTTPACIRALYNISTPTTTSCPASNVTFAIYATEAASFSNADLQKYLKKYNPAAAGSTYKVIGTGDPVNGSPSIASKFETALDTQVALGLAYPAKGLLYNLGGVFGPVVGKTYDPFVTFLTQLLTNSTDSLPSVVSISESQPENKFDKAYATRLCNLIAQVSLRGITIVSSSGNNGPNGDSPAGEHKTIFEPEFPASCPYVLAVGGTTNLADEQAATKSTIPFLSSFGYVASGGGFSNIFPAPSWQYSFVQKYTSQHVPEAYKANGTGYPQPAGAIMAGVPDVAAISTSWPTIVNGLEVPIGGTSSAAPTWAAVIALLNAHEQSNGRPNLGFVNPWLYTLVATGRGGLKDIVKGGNNKGECDLLQGCTLTTFGGKQLLGYDVTEGWDPVTGLGSPNFGVLRERLDERAGHY